MLYILPHWHRTEKSLLNITTQIKIHIENLEATLLAYTETRVNNIKRDQINLTSKSTGTL